MDLTYDPALVALSIGMAMLGSFTGLVVTAGIARADPYEAALRIILAALGVGGGVWATHSIAMIAIDGPAPLSLDLIRMAGAALAATLFAGVAMLIGRLTAHGALAIPAGAACLAAGMAAMYALGVSATMKNYGMIPSWPGLAFAFVIALQASAAVLWFAFHDRGLPGTFLGSAALGLAISAAQYSAAEASGFAPLGDALGAGAQQGVNYSLALSIATTIYVICGFCIGIFMLVGMIKRSRPGGAAG